MQVKIFAPQEEDAARPGGDWECVVEIEEDGNARTLVGRGVDSLQALTNAHAALYRTFQPAMSRLRWLGEPGDLGFPLVVPHEDPNFLELVDHLIIAESCRYLVWRQALDKLQDDH